MAVGVIVDAVCHDKPFRQCLSGETGTWKRFRQCLSGEAGVPKREGIPTYL